MSEDIKNAISDLGQTFNEFKKVNDERLENIEKGESTAYNEEKLSKLAPPGLEGTRAKVRELFHRSLFFL